MPKKTQPSKSSETPFGRFESLMKKLVQVPKEEVDRKPRSEAKKKRPKQS